MPFYSKSSKVATTVPVDGDLFFLTLISGQNLGQLILEADKIWKKTNKYEKAKKKTPALICI